VKARNQRSLALETGLGTAGSRYQDPSVESNDPNKLDIAVIFTSVESTVVALKRAGALAGALGARITLFVPQVVPYPLPLASPPVLLDWSERRFRTIANASPVETIVRLFLCRDRLQTLMNALNPRSLVVIGNCGKWWPLTRERRLAGKLRRAGHEVILTESE